MSQQLMGKKLGMTHLFDEQGALVVCTVIGVEPNVVTQIKTKETDGYTAIQTGFETIQGKDPRSVVRRAGKPMFGHFKKANVEPRRNVMESRVDSVEGFTLGQEIRVDIFNDVEFVDVTGISIGKGYQGVMKRYNHKCGPASHGTKKTHRSLGSIGNRAGRIFKGGKMPGHMGDEQVTIQNLKVAQIDEKENLILVKGAIPGAKNSVVRIGRAVKKSGAK